MIKIELKSLIVELNVSNLGDDFFKQALFPGLSGMSHHGQSRVIIFLVFVIEEDKL